MRTRDALSPRKDLEGVGSGMRKTSAVDDDDDDDTADASSRYLTSIIGSLEKPPPLSRERNKR